MQDWRRMEWGQEGRDTQEGPWGGPGAHLIPGMQLPSRAPCEVAGAYCSSSDSHSWWGEPGLDNLIRLFHL